MQYSDKWFFERLQSVDEHSLDFHAKTAFGHVHGSNKKPKVVIDILDKNLNSEVIKNCRKALADLDSVLDKQFAELIKYCAVIYANFCDEIFTGLDDFYFRSIIMEWLLHSESGYTKGRYRDHLTHQLKVTLLGIDFLDGNNGMPPLSSHIVDALRTSLPLLEYLRGEGITPNTIDKNIVMASWLIAGMFHDIGYCFVMFIKTSRMVKGVSDFFEFDISKDIWKKVEEAGCIQEHSYICQFYKAYGEGLNEKSTLDEIKERIKQSTFESPNHSVIGALYLLYMLKQFEKSAEQAFADGDFKKRMRLTFELAALAILTHDIDSQSKQMHSYGADKNKRLFKSSFAIPFKDYPVSYLLGICDQLQDWGRRRIVREPLTNSSCVEKYVVECDSQDITVKDKKLIVRFHVPFSALNVMPSYWALGDKVQLGGDGRDVPDSKTLLGKYHGGRAYILSHVYGSCPAWNGYSLVVEAGGTTFSTTDYFSHSNAKKALA